MRRLAGPAARGSAIPREMSFQAGDLTDQVDLSGRLVVQYASFSLGTPVNDNLSQGGDLGHVLANQPFLACLPQRLLSLPEGAAPWP